MRKNELACDNIYHIYNRGVEKRLLFLNNNDYSRFIQGLVIFNDIKPALNFKYKIDKIENSAKKKKPLVNILAFCLMPNHFHLLLQPREDNGITKFMRKLCVGYANYFNLKYQRVGSLFQGKFKSVLIDDESQFTYIPYYVHLNPLDLIYSDWRNKGINEPKKALDFLGSYKWSSYRDYIGKRNFPFVIHKDLLNEFFGGEVGHKRAFHSFIKDSNFFEFFDNSTIDFGNQ